MQSHVKTELKMNNTLHITQCLYLLKKKKIIPMQIQHVKS